MVKDLNPWVNGEILLKNGVNPAMNSYSIDSNRLLAPSEPGAVISSTPHEKTGLFCGTSNTLFRDKIMESHGNRDFTRIIEKEINQLPERLSKRAMIGEEIEEEIRKGYNTIASYIAGTPMVSSTMFKSFEKFGDVGEKKEPWEVKDMEQLFNAIYNDLKTWKQICCPWCFTIMQKEEFKIHYLQNHMDNIMLVNTCDMIKSNHRAFVSLIIFMILCLEDNVQILFTEEMNKLKQPIKDLECEKEINSKTPGYK